jgi:pimeloyl-ACP methyl ester carboxylesterase
MRQHSVQKLDPREAHYWIGSPRPGLKLFLRHLAPMVRRDRQVRPVLYVHGATFPSGLSIAHRFDGKSWRDALCAAGFDVWGFDFLGFGHSDRYPEMDASAEAHAPLCRTEEASEQVEAAVRFILDRHAVLRLSIITHSWASMPAGRFAGCHPELVDRLVMFGPIARRPPRRYERTPLAPAWRIVTLADQWARFVEDVPAGEPPVLSHAHFAEWGERYLDSDPASRNRAPAGVKIPTGPFADILHAWHGDLAYDPALIEAPVAIIRGEWDGLIPDEDARWLFDALKSSPGKRDIKIGRGTHLMHLEAMRHALHAESIMFLADAVTDDRGRTTDDRRQGTEERCDRGFDVANRRPSVVCRPSSENESIE